MVEQESEEFDDFDDNIEFEEPEQQIQTQPQQTQPQQPRVEQPRVARNETGQLLPRPAGRPPQKRPQMTPQRAAASAVPISEDVPEQTQQAAIKQATPTQAPQARFIPYEMPKRIGLLDRVTGKPIIEDEDMLRVVMAQLADIKNDLEEIKSYYN